MESKYSDTVKVIENMASVKLAMNSHKGDIEKMDYHLIMTLLKDEVKELEQANSILEVIEEASDVYNFLMALVHKKITEYRKRNDGK